MPGTNSFISEFLVLIGTFTRLPGLGDHRDRRHRAGRRLHAVDLPADDDRSGRVALGGAAAARTAADDGRRATDRDARPAIGPVPARELRRRSACTRRRATVGRRRSTATVGRVEPPALRRRAARTHGAGVRVRAKFGDLTAREITVLTPLVVLIILLGRLPAAGAGRDQPDRRADHGRRRVHRPAAGRRRRRCEGGSDEPGLTATVGRDVRAGPDRPDHAPRRSTSA